MRMISSDVSGVLQSRLSAFVKWIRTEPEREEDIRERAANIRKAIRSRAIEEGLVVRSTPNAGSFATRTGLRRHMRGESEVEGRDVDLPFVVAPRAKNDERLDTLLPRFEGYARAAYPDTRRESVKSSVKLLFTDKVNFDLVPLLATQHPERQILIRTDGERRETSIERHIEFVSTRTERSKRTAFAVNFNDLVRLLKWWRCCRQATSSTIKEVPSFLVTLLSAHAFDCRGVQVGYAETLADWFGLLGHVVRKRVSIAFGDYAAIPKPTNGNAWAVHDPVNAGNNLVEKWSGVMCDELAEWLEESRDALYDAIAAFDDEREIDGIERLVCVFGNAIRYHSENS